jgi:hypothetical protein
MESTLRKTIRATILGLAIAGALVPAAQAQEEEFIPGYTDFPNALRIETDSSETFVPGHTDFPNHLRFDSEYDRARFQSGLYGGVITVRRVSPGFDWNDAALGAGGATVVLLLGTGLAALVLRRPIRRAALTG